MNLDRLKNKRLQCGRRALLTSQRNYERRPLWGSQGPYKSRFLHFNVSGCTATNQTSQIIWELSVIGFSTHIHSLRSCAQLTERHSWKPEEVPFTKRSCGLKRGHVAVGRDQVNM